MRGMTPAGPARWWAAVLLGSVAVSSLRAQDSALSAALRATRLVVRIEAGRLAGPGGELLAREAGASRFTLVGEEHGVRQVPELVSALLTAVRPAGYRYFAIEVSPLAARRIAEVARQADPEAALAELLRDDMNWMPFYTMPPETALLGRAISPAGGGYTVWGLDYEIWADRYWLRRLEEMVDPAARPAVAAARARADSGFVLASRGDPSQVFSFTAPESLFTAIRQAARPEPGSDVGRILAVLERTVDINRPFLAGRNYESNQKRSAYLKENFLRYLRQAEGRGDTARAVLKFGAYHMDRGLNGVRQYDVGWLAAAVAEAEGGRSLHLLVVGGPGTEHAVFDVQSLRYRPRPVEWIGHQWMAPVREALAPEGYSLFDLRPLRALLHDRRLRNVAPELERVIFGFDLLVVLTGSSPSVH